MQHKPTERVRAFRKGDPAPLNPSPATPPPSAAKPDLELAHGYVEVPGTEFIGRDEIIKEILKWLQDPVKSLITLTGTGGVGKTRLALEVKSQVEDRFPGGTAFVPLADAQRREEVLATIARKLNLPPNSDQSANVLAEEIKEKCQGKKFLLVLDNLEHILNDAQKVLTALFPGASPSTNAPLKVLATSREALNLNFEQAVCVEPMKLPEGECEASPDCLRENEAIKLFVKEAERHSNKFTQDQDLKTICKICELVDCLPLAIRLAAGRTKYESLGGLLESLQKSPLALLSKGPADVPQRHQSMSNCIAWSYNLLDDDLQVVFRRLAVFIGGFSFEDAKNVTGAEQYQMDKLQDINLIDRDRTTERYTMLQTVREFGVKKLAELGDDLEFREKAANYFLEKARKIPNYPASGTMPDKLDAWEADHANFLYSLDWFITQKKAQEAMELVHYVSKLWYYRNYYTIALNLLREVLGITGANLPEHAIHKARVLCALGLFSRYVVPEKATPGREWQEAQKQSRTYYEQSIKQFVSILDPTGKKIPSESYESYYDELRRRTEGRDQKFVEEVASGLAECWNGIGVLCRNEGKQTWNDAETCFCRSQQLHALARDDLGRTIATHNLAELQIRMGRCDDAERNHVEVLRIRSDKLGDFGTGPSWSGLGEVALCGQAFDKAAVRFLKAAEVNKRIGSKMGTGKAILGICRAVVKKCVKSPESDTKNLQRAAWLLAAVRAIFQRQGAVLTPEVNDEIDYLERELRKSLGNDYDGFSKSGSELSLDEALELASELTSRIAPKLEIEDEQAELFARYPAHNPRTP